MPEPIPHEALRSYLGVMANFFRLSGAECGPFPYLLSNGKFFDPAPFTEEEWELLDRVAEGVRGWPPRQCYYNSQRLAVSDGTRQLVYCEGYAVGSAGVPVPHAWVSLHGKVFDITWRVSEKRNRRAYRTRNAGDWDPNRYAYMGVEMPRVDWLTVWPQMQMVTGPVLSQYPGMEEVYLEGKPLLEVLPRLPEYSR